LRVLQLTELKSAAQKGGGGRKSPGAEVRRREKMVELWIVLESRLDFLIEAGRAGALFDAQGGDNQ
jgi:hypothetical protein